MLGVAPLLCLALLDFALFGVAPLALFGSAWCSSRLIWVRWLGVASLGVVLLAWFLSAWIQFSRFGSACFALLGITSLGLVPLVLLLTYSLRS